MNFGYEKCLPEHSFGPQVREYYVLHYILEGSGTYTFKNSIYSLTKDDFFLIKPQDSAALYQAAKENPWRYIWLGFEGNRAEELLREYGFYDDNRVGHCMAPKELAVVLEELLHRSFFLNANVLLIQGKLLSVLGYLTLDSPNTSLHSNKTNAERLIEQFIFYVKQNYWRQELSVKQISSELAVTPSYLTRVITQYLGQSAGAYLVNYRMIKARFLVENTDHSIEAIAKATGYQNPLSFSRAFKRVYGRSPRNIVKNEE